MTDAQKTILRDLLEAKAEEIRNYDMDEPWAEDTLDAIQAYLEEE